MVAVWPLNAFEPRPSTRAIIPATIAQLPEGPRIQVGNLRPRLDFTFIVDTVAGFPRAAAVLGLIAGLLGVAARGTTETKRLRYPNSEVNRLYSANQRAIDVWGWAPTISLEEDLRCTVDPFQEQSRLVLDRQLPLLRYQSLEGFSSTASSAANKHIKSVQELGLTQSPISPPDTVQAHVFQRSG